MATSSKSNNRFIAIIAAIFLPPVGLLIHEGITSRFWICLILTIIFFLPGMIYAIYHILQD